MPLTPAARKLTMDLAAEGLLAPPGGVAGGGSVRAVEGGVAGGP